ncbi:MAG TPA: hypothetical protein VIK22_14090 [Candidatus Anoxymicrobiaceae bacterium]
MRCEECGAGNVRGSTFCQACGASIPGGEQVGATVASAPPSTTTPEVPVAEKTQELEAEEVSTAREPAALAVEEAATTPTPPTATTAPGPAATSAVEVPADSPVAPTTTPAAPMPTFSARALSTAWMRRGPIVMALFIVLMMAMVFAPWAFIRIEVLGLSLVSRSFSGWDIFVARVLFFLLIIPLVISLMMIAGIGTRRRVLETHIITFFLGFMFVIWGGTYGLSLVLKSLIKHLRVVQVMPAGAQIATVIFLVGLIFGIIITTYDRGRQLIAMAEGG